MKITAVKTFPVTLRYRNYLFEVETDEGFYGVGEFGVTFREQASLGALEHMKADLVGQDPMNIERIWQVLFRGSFFPGGRINAGAISALDIALWDIKGKALRQPVYILLGGLLRNKVVCYTAVGGPRPQDTAAQAVAKVKEGWRYIRMSAPDRGGILEPRLCVKDAIEHFAATREAVGTDIELCIDVHTRLDTPDTIRLGRELEQYDPFFIEDPLRCENLQSYRVVRNHVSCPLAAGEQLASKWKFRQLIEEELIDYARIDICNMGGLTEARKIAN